MKALKMAVGIVGGLCLMLILGSATANMTGARDAQLPETILPLVKETRASLMRADAFRSLCLVLLAAGLSWAALQRKLNTTWVIVGIGMLIIGDAWSIGKRILFNEKFESAQAIEAEKTPMPANQQIASDTDPHFRVLDLANGNPFTSTEASRFHKSIGGYHAAKLMLYQDLIERYLSKPNESLHILGMLNTKYVIQDPKSAQRLPQALGNAWFVRSFKTVEDANAEIDALATLKPAEEAVLQKKHATSLAGLNITPDSTATIRLTAYHPDTLTYEYNASTGEQLAVFSEIYYPPSKGWKVYLDGQVYQDFVKVNYALRALRVPAGKHKLEMRFEPSSYRVGDGLSKIASIVSILLTLVAVGLFAYKKMGEQADVRKT